MRIFLFTLMLAFLTPFISKAQSHTVNQFYRTHKKTEDVRNIKLPGFLIRFGTNIAKRHADDAMEKEALGMAGQIKKMRLMVAENGGAIPA
ncbi:MAG: DUF4252 domain-containing protein, partial [Saprospiraceae bacterium]|nr:DUF4252 domain-containing protein [Saprospiraceae bacterium]